MPLLRPYCVRRGLSSLSQKGHSPPQFSACVYCGQTAGWIKTSLRREVGLGPCDIVLDGNPALLPPKKEHSSHHFLAHVYCGKTARWIKMPLGVEMGIGPDHIASMGTQLPPPKRGHSPQCLAHVCCSQSAGWIKMPLDKEVGLSAGDIVSDGGPNTPKRGKAPLFGPCLYCGQTVAHLSYCRILVQTVAQKL